MKSAIPDAIRVLVVEHSDTGRFLARQLLEQFDLDFTWQSVGSEPELRDIAQEFNPTVVLCVDERAPNAAHASLDMLRLLSTQKPVILVSEVNVSNTRGVSHESALRPDARPDDTWVSGAAREPDLECAAGLSPLPRYVPSLLEADSDVVLMSDSDGWLTYASSRACSLLSASREQLLVTLLGTYEDEVLRAPNWADAKAGGDSAAHAPRRPRAHRIGFIGDPASIPVQAHVNDLIGCLTARARDGNSSLALVGLNLDGLQLLSEAHGRAMSDEVLNHVGSVLRSGPTRCGMAARVGQDDFVIVLPELSDASNAAIAVRGILLSISERRQWTALDHPRQDMADIPETKHDLPEMEDLALFAYDRTDPAARLQTEGGEHTAPQVLPGQADLNDAIQRNALSLQYQPQFDLSNGRGSGVEVLARWIRSNGESMPPAVFIPLAERGGTIRTLGAWVLECACQTAAAWRGRDSENLTLSVNVSTQQIDDRFQGVIAGILKNSGFPARRLELEISESAIIANTDQTIRCLKQWKDLGVRIAVNHFGIDYSSLSYLSRLKVDRLKLDKSLIRNMTLHKKSEGVMYALISLGAALGVNVIAEGVETEPQFQMLARLGCPQVQGYLLARPMHATQAQVALRKPWGNLPSSAHRPGAGAAPRYAS